MLTKSLTLCLSAKIRAKGHGLCCRWRYRVLSSVPTCLRCQSFLGQKVMSREVQSHQFSEPRWCLQIWNAAWESTISGWHEVLFGGAVVMVTMGCGVFVAKQRGLWQKRPKEKVLTQHYQWLQCCLLQPRQSCAFWDPQLPAVSSSAALPLSQFSKVKFVWSKWECDKAELYVQEIRQPAECEFTCGGRITNCVVSDIYCLKQIMVITETGEGTASLTGGIWVTGLVLPSFQRYKSERNHR